jgi:hypothetical protein
VKVCLNWNGSIYQQVATGFTFAAKLMIPVTALGQHQVTFTVGQPEDAAVSSFIDEGKCLRYCLRFGFRGVVPATYRCITYYESVQLVPEF